MYFDSLNELIAMAGHGGYVWSSYIISALVIVALLVVPTRQYRAAMKRVAMQVQAADKAASNVEINVENTVERKG